MPTASSPTDASVEAGLHNTAAQKKARTAPIISPFLVEMNEKLAVEDLDVRIDRATWITPAATGQAGQTVFANDRGNKQLDLHFVPGDPRRDERTNITYVIDGTDGAATGGLANDDTEPAIDRAMATWQDVECADVTIDKAVDPGMDIGFVEALFTDSGLPMPVQFADLIHGGWLPAEFFDAIADDGADFILGVTFTLTFVDDDDNPTDIDGDGKTDVAFREIYYNNNFAWGIDTGGSPIDVETIALHEAGHGLSQGHFGRIHQTDANGKLHFAPFAVMNAAYSRQAQALEGTDLSGHCSIWGSWPDS